MIGIYKITNKLNGKSYIGQSNDIKRRWSEHKRNIGSSKNPLYLAFEKYGLENFTFDVLEECELNELNTKEKYWINYYNSFNNGYNLTEGGQIGSLKQFIPLNIEGVSQQCKKFLKEKNWVVYYFLLSISNYNNEEKHRYVYRSQFNISLVSKNLGISRSTFYTSLEKLEKVGLLEPNINKDYYIIPIKSSWAQIHQDILIGLLGYSQTQGIDLLRTYLFCRMLYEKNGYNKGFTKRNLIRCLGHSENDDIMYERVEVYFDLLEKWKLIYLNIETVVDNLGEHEIFHLAKVEKTSEELSKRLEKRVQEKQNPYGLSAEEEKEFEI